MADSNTIVAAVGNGTDVTVTLCELLAGVIAVAAVGNAANGTAIPCDLIAGIKADTGSTGDDGLGVGLVASLHACFLLHAVGIGVVLLDARRRFFAGIEAAAAVRTVVAGGVASYRRRAAGNIAILTVDICVVGTSAGQAPLQGQDANILDDQLGWHLAGGLVGIFDRVGVREDGGDALVVGGQRRRDGAAGVDRPLDPAARLGAGTGRSSTGGRTSGSGAEVVRSVGRRRAAAAADAAMLGGAACGNSIQIKKESAGRSSASGREKKNEKNFKITREGCITCTSRK